MLSHAPALDGWHTLACSEPLALLVDLDGTLIDHAPTQDAVLDPDAIRILSRLVAAGVQVVVVSGRPCASIDRMRALVPGAWWVAEHGSWRWARAEDSDRAVRVREDRADLAARAPLGGDAELCAQPVTHVPELDELARRIASATPDARLERKSLSLCIHGRTLSEDALAAVEIACDEWLEEHPAFERIGCVEVVEVRLRSVHKGAVVKWVRDRLAGVRVIAIGDDLTDEDMFAELDDGDASVSVGPRAMQADAHAADVDTARAFLRWIADARGGRRELAFPLTPAADRPQRKRHRLLVISNRTPALTQGRTREVGGLVSALEPALRDERGIWLGWSGQERGHGARVVVDATEQPARARFDLPPAVREQFYAGFCNSVLWPLFHGFPNRVRCNDGDWEAYVRANERFARHAVELAQRDATIWVHDYHLLLCARALRALGHEGRIGLFLHIPFPTTDVLATIPYAADLVEAMLDFDLLGFQTQQSVTNFLGAARRAKRPERIADVDVFPATIDPRPFRRATDERREVAGMRAVLGGCRLLLGVDRLDYSKGIPERLDAFERMLERHPEWRRRVTFLQISVPSRAEIPEYAELRQRVEALVGRINGRFGETDWVPVRYLYRSFDQQVLAQLYRLADVALVTPLRDGMNLVAKEFVAAQDPTRPGVLVLSQFAGAAETLASALITNPFNPESLAADIDLALRMPAAERMHRYRSLAAALEREGDAKFWAERYLARLAPRRLRTVH